MITERILLSGAVQASSGTLKASAHDFAVRGRAGSIVRASRAFAATAARIWALMKWRQAHFGDAARSSSGLVEVYEDIYLARRAAPSHGDKVTTFGRLL